MEADPNTYFLAGRWVQQGQLHWDQQGSEVRGQRISGSNALCRALSKDETQ